MQIQGVPARNTRLLSTVRTAGVVELALTDEQMPSPVGEQVLLRIEAAPVNPSDLRLLFAGGDLAQATTDSAQDRPLFSVPLSPRAARAAAARVGVALPVGNEGAGVVVATGDAPSARALLGSTVSVTGGGMYAQYRVLPAAECLVLPDGTRPEQAAASFVNPMTALGMVTTMRAEGHIALVHTAAASALGQMLVRLCAAEGVPLVNVVRSSAQVQLLQGLGALHVVDSTSPNFTHDLVAAITETGATLAFDAVGGGELANHVLAAMEAAAGATNSFSPYGSTVRKHVYIYGGLDPAPTQLTRNYGMSWGVGGWLVRTHLQSLGAQRTAELRARVATELTTTFATTFTDRISLRDALQPSHALAYGTPTTSRKYLLTPQK